jgi:cytoskeletal protein RodZ
METKSGLGEYLRSERERRNITIEQVASATKINIKLLHALESDNYDALPAKPFVRGFVASYTRYVGLDHREILTRFENYLDEKSGKKFKRPEDAPHIFVEKEGQTDNSKTALTVVMISFMVIAIIVFVLVKPKLKHKRHGKDKVVVSNEEMVTVVPPPSENTPLTATPEKSEKQGVKTEATTPTVEKKSEKPADKQVDSAAAAKATPKAKPTPAPKPTPTPKPTPSAAAETKSQAPTQTAAAVPGKIPPIPNNEVKHRLVVRANEDSWVKYQVDDRPVQAYTLRKEKTIFVRARTSIRFSAANPKALEISFDNKTFQPFGTNNKLIVLPKSAEAEFKTQPFIPPNPAYLSTPTQ